MNYLDRVNNKIKRMKSINSIAKETGEKKTVVKERLIRMKAQYGISFTEFNKRGLYKFTDEEIDKRYKNINIRVIAEILGISFEAAKSKMDRLKEKYNISYQEYADNKLYVYKTKKKLEERIERINQKKERYIQNVANDTGWTYSEAKKNADKVRRKYGISYKKYAGYRFFEMSNDEIKAKIDKWNEKAQYYRDYVMKESGWDEDRVRLHMRRIAVQYDIPPAYYVCYRAWELSDEQIDGYARQKLSERIWRKYNDKDQANVLAEKDKFDLMYKDYIKRKFWINVDTNYGEFMEFIDGLEAVFCKPILFGGGLGTEKHIVDHDNPKKLYELLMSKPKLLVEECVKQHPEVDEFLPGCVNTVRAVTIQDKDGGINIICTGIRFGYNGITDNFSQDGMVADVDPNTGIIITDAVDKKGNTYEFHPISGKKFKGFQIPLWEEAIRVAKEAITVQDGVNYVGWDLAICEDKVVIIEGNSMPDLVLIQAPYARNKVGKRYLFDPYLKKNK